jgi:hypothetical protein
MRVTAAALLALILAPVAAARPPEVPPPDVLAAAYPRLHDAAKDGPAHAGRDVLEHGRPRDGRLSWSLLRREAERLWWALHPWAAAQRERVSRETAPAWWVAAAAPLRWCEARGVYSTDTGNGYYGAYQFNWGTWAGVGGSGNPAHATPAEQDWRAYLLWQRRGWQPWPTCGRLAGG